MKGIGTVGLPGSGKTVFSNVAREMNLPVVRMGDVVIEEVKRNGLEPTSENIGAMAEKLRKEHGKGIIARKTVEKLENIKAECIVIDGIRSLEEVHIFREFFHEFILIAVFSSAETRHERILKRNRHENIHTRDQIKKRDARELAFGVGNAMALSNEVLVNENKGYEAFKAECQRKVKELKKDC